MSLPHLVRLVAPAELPISVAEVRAQARIDSTAEDNHLALLIAAAVAHVDATGVLGRGIITQTWAQWVPPSPGTVRLSLGGVSQLTAVHYIAASDGALTEATLADYELIGSPAAPRVRPKTGHAWPAAADRPDAIRLSFVTGYGDDPEDVPTSVRLALMMLVAHWYETREPVTGQGAPVSIPIMFDALIEGQRIGWYA